MKKISFNSIKKRHVYSLLTLLIIIVLFMLFPFDSNNKETAFRALPRPIGGEPLMITSAGQSTDIYIVKDIANKLMIDNYFMPLATAEQVNDVKSAVIVIGYSEVGIRLNDLDFQQEKKRVLGLINEIKQRDIALITVYLRGSRMLASENKELLELVIKYSDYLIVTEENGNNMYFEELAASADIPITIVDDVNEVSEPFVSVFR